MYQWRKSLDMGKLHPVTVLASSSGVQNSCQTHELRLKKQTAGLRRWKFPLVAAEAIHSLAD
jgi:hypothetical protein